MATLHILGWLQVDSIQCMLAECVLEHMHEIELDTPFCSQVYVEFRECIHCSILKYHLLQETC